MSLAVALSVVMSEFEYDQERARLRELYGDNSAEAAAKRDQAMADLFRRSGWTQEKLAAKESKSQNVSVAIWSFPELYHGRDKIRITSSRSNRMAFSRVLE
jgi:hypothetical protein